MSAPNDPRLKRVWQQGAVPIILRRDGAGERLRVKLPFAEDNRRWLQNGRRTNPAWSMGFKCWELPKAWFDDFITRALQRYPAIYVIQPYREYEKCSDACMNAKGHECQCSCMGANHGAGNDGSWFEVSETFATRWGQRELACRLMTARQDGGSRTDLDPTRH